MICLKKQRIIWMLFVFFIIQMYSDTISAEVPNAVQIDVSNWNGAVNGEVVNYEVVDSHLEAKVRIKNPKYYWTKIKYINMQNETIIPNSLYANFGYLGPASSTIPFDPGFSSAEYILEFENESSLSIGVDPTIESGIDAAYLNVVQVILTASPVPLDSSISVSTLETVIDSLKDLKEIADKGVSISLTL